VVSSLLLGEYENEQIQSNGNGGRIRDDWANGWSNVEAIRGFIIHAGSFESLGEAQRYRSRL